VVSLRQVSFLFQGAKGASLSFCTPQLIFHISLGFLSNHNISFFPPSLLSVHSKSSTVDVLDGRPRRCRRSNFLRRRRRFFSRRRRAALPHSFRRPGSVGPTSGSSIPELEVTIMVGMAVDGGGGADIST